jgi:hypothetical protein
MNFFPVRKEMKLCSRITNNPSPNSKFSFKLWFYRIMEKEKLFPGQTIWKQQ